MNATPVILVVDDNEDNIKVLTRPLKKEGYRILEALSGEEALNIVRKSPPDLIILDVMMPGLTGFEVCQILKKDPEYQLIPIVMVTALNELKDKIKALGAGADDFLNKPVNRHELMARAKSLLRLKNLTDRLESAEAVIFSLAEAVEARDEYTGGHTERVGKLAVIIGRKMNLSEADIENLSRGGIVHDIGKIGIRDHILNKPGQLVDDEFDIMKKHPEIGYEICKSLKTTKGLLDLILLHHEKLDGSGYPKGLKGEQIPLPVRILAVADIYDALITNRPYRKSLSHEQVFEILDNEVFLNRIDGTVVECLKAHVYQFGSRFPQQ